MSHKNIIYRYYIFSFVSGLHFVSAVLVPFFTDWGGVSLATAQALQSWFTFCVFLLEVPTGIVADTFGRKHSVAFGSFMIAIGVIVYGTYPSLPLFVLGEFLLAASIALISGADKALIYDTLVQFQKEEKAVSVFGKGRAIHLVGITLGAPIGSIIAKYFGLNAPMLFTAIPACMASVVAWSIPEPKVISEEAKERRNFLLIAKQGLKEISGSLKLRRWTINGTIVAAAAYFVIWLYQPLMAKLGMPIALYGIAHAGLAIVQVVLAASFERFVTVFKSQRRFLEFSALVTSGSLLLAAIWPNPLTLILMITLAGGFGLTRMELMTVEMNKLVRARNRATVISSISMFRRLTQAILNPFVGLATDHSVQTSLFFVGLIPLLTLLYPLNEET
jgi:MFS family permease